MRYKATWNLSTIPDDALYSEVGKRRRAAQTSPPNPKVLAPCKWCGQQFGARELRAHKPKCRKAQKGAK